MTGHLCIIEKTADPFSVVDQFQVRCRCHMDVWKTWRPGDTVVECPVSGSDLTDGPVTAKPAGGR